MIPFLNAEIVSLFAGVVGAKDRAPGLPIPRHYFEFPCGRSRDGSMTINLDLGMDKIS